MKTNRHRASWLAGLFGLAVLLFVSETVQAQAVRGLTSIAGKWGGGTPMLTAGSSHTCALTGDGLVRCWGFNSVGQLGDGTTTRRTIPVVVKGILTDAVAVAAGGFHTCGLTAKGRVLCWGSNSNGQLGDNSRSNRITPVTVIGITNAVAVAAGDRHTCAVLATGSVQCWGDNSQGQLGDESTTSRLTPVTTVQGITNAVSVTAGVHHTCALLTTGVTQCWGENAAGQLGNGNFLRRLTPVTVSGITNAVMIQASAQHTCALLATGNIREYSMLGRQWIRSTRRWHHNDTRHPSHYQWHQERCVGHVG